MVANILGALIMCQTQSVLSPLLIIKHLTKQLIEIGATLSSFVDECLKFKKKAKVQRD